MNRTRIILVALVALAGTLGPGAAFAGDGEHQLLPWSKKRKADPANFRYHRWFPQRAPSEALSGYPHEVSAIAHPRYSEKYWGYYVGGGKAHGGTEPTIHEGTFGWDYVGHPWLHSKVYLGWTRRKYQGGIGAYDTRTPEAIHHAGQREGNANPNPNGHGVGDGHVHAPGH